MAQVTATIDDDTLERVDAEALRNGISRSKQIAVCVREFFEPSLEGVDLEKLTLEIDHLKEIILGKDERIRDLQNQTGWLQSEYHRLNTILDRFALPAPAESPWWKFWKR